LGIGGDLLFSPGRPMLWGTIMFFQTGDTVHGHTLLAPGIVNWLQTRSHKPMIPSKPVRDKIICPHVTPASISPSIDAIRIPFPFERRGRPLRDRQRITGLQPPMTVAQPGETEFWAPAVAHKDVPFLDRKVRERLHRVLVSRHRWRQRLVD